jgi:acyl-CoA thioesterase FadM
LIIIRRRVLLPDTDASGLIFFGAPARWVAEAHAELMGSIGRRWGGTTATPTRAYEVAFERPLRVDDEIEHTAWVSEIGRTSFAVAHEIRCRGAIAVTATSRHVHVRLADMTPLPVPDEIVRGLRDGPTRPPRVLDRGEPLDP